MHEQQVCLWRVVLAQNLEERHHTYIPTGSDARNFARKFGYSLRGMRAEVPSLLVRGQRSSAMSAIDHNGLIDVNLTTGTVNSDTFYQRRSATKPSTF